MNPSLPPPAIRAAALLAIVLSALSIIFGGYQGKVMTVGPIVIVVIVVALISLRRSGR